MKKVIGTMKPKNCETTLKKEYKLYLLLENCLFLNTEKQKAADKLNELKAAAYYPRNQNVSDEPKCGNESINRLDIYVIKQEKLEREILILNKQILHNWRIACKILKNATSNNEEIELMRMRFYLGWKWKKCSAAMQKKHGGQWNINKVFKVYRLLLAKCTK